jgi:heme-degrading monooxygenase HmoA
MRWTCRDGIMLVTENEDSQWDERVGKEERGMHARVSKLEGPPEQVNELGRIVAEWVAPSLTQMNGFRGILALADRQSGKVEVVTLWESEEAMRQSEEEAEQLRGDIARAADGAIAGVERYEVVLSYTL